VTSLCEAGFAFSVVHVTNNKYSEMRIMSVERKGNFFADGFAFVLLCCKANIRYLFFGGVKRGHVQPAATTKKRKN